MKRDARFSEARGGARGARPACDAGGGGGDGPHMLSLLLCMPCGFLALSGFHSLSCSARPSSDFVEPSASVHLGLLISWGWGGCEFNSYHLILPCECGGGRGHAYQCNKCPFEQGKAPKRTQDTGYNSHSGEIRPSDVTVRYCGVERSFFPDI